MIISKKEIYICIKRMDYIAKQPMKTGNKTCMDCT